MGYLNAVLSLQLKMACHGMTSNKSRNWPKNEQSSACTTNEYGVSLTQSAPNNPVADGRLSGVFKGIVGTGSGIMVHGAKTV
ncbi:hypothetical protein [Vibrio sp. MEBiC08052]|uniref:hypothetical protein n=1 Tax=Vibrio sp. MEBiC08052 TaxID=1761910 RepID=UPI0007408477|nr:hypothetical protein [Vibrio sp. MEBiC08052]KUI97428.1 hypothetical protein VRK_33990 [Vibrio sp. MEBiC08052]